MPYSQPHDFATLSMRQPTRSAPKRLATIAIITSVMIHGGMLAACICLSHDTIQFVNVRRGAAATENQIVLTASIDSQAWDERIIAPVWAGSADIDRAAEETATHRGIELMRRRDNSAFTSLPDVPPADISFTTSDMVQLRKRAETLDDLKPRPVEMQRRPRQSVRQLPPPVAPHAVVESGTKSWMPEPLASNVPPTYPAEAVQSRVEGTTQLRITVSRDGQVMGIEIKQSSGWPTLDQAAIDAVSKWHFQKQGSKFSAETQTVVIPIEFTLKRGR